MPAAPSIALAACAVGKKPLQQPLPRACRGVLALEDFERQARRRLPRPLYAYISGAAENGHALAGNRRAFVELALRPRVLTGVVQPALDFEMFGRRYSAPFGIAPMGISALSAYLGDIVHARAAQAEGLPAIMSGSSLIRLEDVIAVAPDTWFQAYLAGNIAQIDGLLDRVQAAGVHTLVVTVDAPVAANCENHARAGFSTPLRPSLGLAWQGLIHPRWLFGTFLKSLLRHGMPHFENHCATRGAPILSPTVLRDFSGRAQLDWRHLAAVRQRWNAILIVKGILTVNQIQGFRIHPRPAHAVSDAMLERYRNYPVANVSDAMGRSTGSASLRPHHKRNGRLVGRALTVRTRPGDNLMVHKAIDVSGPGDVIVVDAGGPGANAIIGEIMLALAIARGAAGFVIDGPIRDSDAIGQSSLPVYARGVSHRGPYKDGPGELHALVSIDGMVVRPGDLVLGDGDGDGLVVVMAGQAQEIAARVEAVQRAEDALLQSIADGRVDRAWVDQALRDKGVL